MLLSIATVFGQNLLLNYFSPPWSVPVARYTSIIFISIFPSRIWMFVSFIAFLSALIHREYVFCQHTQSKDGVITGIQMHFSPNREETTLNEHQMCKDLTEFLIQLINMLIHIISLFQNFWMYPSDSIVKKCISITANLLL